jgi:FMN phosphatase YigB (HAD superfamily)
MGGVQIVLYDFGDTLADENWMRAPSPVFPGFLDAYARTLDSRRDDWDRGLLRTSELATLVAARLGCPPEGVLDHMRALCRQLQFFPSIMSAARARRARGAKQAIVTVNPDLLSDVVVCEYGLHDIFDVVVTSWETGTLDKTLLCEIALENLGAARAFADSVLIDNIEENVTAYRQKGGSAYLFTTDQQFAHDVRYGIVPGFDVNDAN